MICERSLVKTNPAQPRCRNLYGRKQSRPLSEVRSAAMDALLPKLGIDTELLGEDGQLDPASLFNAPYKELWFEIGFGSGEHLATQLLNNSQNAYLGAEPFINGFSAFLKTIRPHNPDNIRVLNDDALKLALSLKDNTLDGIYVLNPDPWPKKRHYKRRIISPENLDSFARILKSGGQLIMSTDVEDLAEWMMAQAESHPAFIWADKPENRHKMPGNWVPTRYEQKGLKAGRRQTYLIFKRK